MFFKKSNKGEKVGVINISSTGEINSEIGQISAYDAEKGEELERKVDTCSGLVNHYISVCEDLQTEVREVETDCQELYKEVMQMVTYCGKLSDYVHETQDRINKYVRQQLDNQEIFQSCVEKEIYLNHLDAEMVREQVMAIIELPWYKKNKKNIEKVKKEIEEKYEVKKKEEMSAMNKRIAKAITNAALHREKGEEGEEKGEEKGGEKKGKAEVRKAMRKEKEGEKENKE